MLSMQNAIIALLIVFVVFQIPVPQGVSSMVATLPGMSVLFIVAVCTFYYNPLVGIVSLIAIYELLRRSGVDLFDMSSKYIPSEEKKEKELTAMNEFPMTLEEEVVSSMVPMEHESLGAPSYKPVLEDDGSSLMI